MTTTTDLKINEPSLCIPRVFANITDERVWGVFNELNIGEIDRIDMVHKEGANNNVSYQRVFVHFKMWYSTPEAADVRKRLVKGDTIKIVYDDPWYWKLSPSKAPRPAEAPKRRVGPAVKIELKGESVFSEEKVPEMSGAAALAGKGVEGNELMTEAEIAQVERAPTMERSPIYGEVCRDVSCDEDEYVGDAN